MNCGICVSLFSTSEKQPALTHTHNETKQIDSLVENDTEEKTSKSKRKTRLRYLKFEREREKSEGKKRYICRSIATTTKLKDEVERKKTTQINKQM